MQYRCISHGNVNDRSHEAEVLHLQAVLVFATPIEQFWRKWEVQSERPCNADQGNTGNLKPHFRRAMMSESQVKSGGAMPHTQPPKAPVSAVRFVGALLLLIGGAQVYWGHWLVYRRHSRALARHFRSGVRCAYGNRP